MLVIFFETANGNEKNGIDFQLLQVSYKKGYVIHDISFL